ncbi:MAG: hypothetical protein IJX99_04535 [Clostridia bacterium]|nr:hypothetical protein [Clostridia bacterium]
METANIEKFMPTVYQAEILVKNNLETYRRKGIKAFKIIHGYGSTGKGGGLRTGLRAYLTQLKKAKIIADFVAGEDWSVFNETTRKVLDLDNNFRKDSDLEKSNAGITVIVISWDGDSSLASTPYRPTQS